MQGLRGEVNLTDILLVSSEASVCNSSTVKIGYYRNCLLIFPGFRVALLTPSKFSGILCKETRMQYSLGLSLTPALTHSSVLRETNLLCLGHSVQN